MAILNSTRNKNSGNYENSKAIVRLARIEAAEKYGNSTSNTGTVTFFIQTFFIRYKDFTNFLYAGQSLYGTK